MFTFRKLFGKSSQPHRRHTASRQPRSAPLTVEKLDDRILPAGVTYHGGAIIPNVRVEPIFYGSSWSANATLKQQAQDITTFWQSLTNSSYMDELGQYFQYRYAGGQFVGLTYVGHGSTHGADITGDGPTSGTVYDNPDTTGASSSNLTTQDVVRREMLVGNVDSANQNTLYIVYLAPGVQFNTQNGNITSAGYYGYHDHSGANDGFYYGASWIPSFNYAVLGYPGSASTNVFPTLTWHSTHEFAEAVTDPDLSTGWYLNNAQNEIGDLANGITGQLGSYTVEYQWSNQDNAPALWTGTAHWARMANGTVSQTISALNKNGVEEMFGIGGSGYLYMQIQDGANGGWHGNWQYLNGAGKQFAVGKEANGLLTLFAIGTDNSVSYLNEVSPGNWSGAQWHPIGGPGTWGNAIAVGSDSWGQQEVFVAGGDHAVYYARETSSSSASYTGFTSLGGSAQWETGSKKTLAVNHEADGRLTLFAIGTDNTPRYLDQVSPAFGPNYWSTSSSWQSMTGAAQDIAVGRMANGALEVFVVGMNGHLYSQWQTSANGYWTGWQYFGQGVVSQIAVGYTTSGKLEVFGIGLDNAVYSIVPTNSSADLNLGWTGLGGYASSLSLGYNQDGSFTLFTVGSDSDVYTAKVG
jgi:hypothetical protein